MSDPCCPEEFLGADPAHVKWRVVRGDTATLVVQFYENDETTFYDTSTWTYLATVYDSKANRYDQLNIEVNSGYINITASPQITSTWGIGTKTAELSFDVQVTIDGTTVWTPILGTISLVGDVTGV
jgi:hypothetical protein